MSRGWLAGAVGLVFVASFFPVTAGGCGTGHAFLMYALAHFVETAVSPDGGHVAHRALMAVLNTAIFTGPAVILHVGRAGLRTAYPIVLGGWTLFFLWSFFFAFPTGDCL